ncbi:transposable element Tcb2 transposase [Trichonephila clavipes]|nr:transposable element Tcb2 transposase [Trichonephila clavipes]
MIPLQIVRTAMDPTVLADICHAISKLTFYQISGMWLRNNVGFVSSSASAAPRNSCKSAFIQDPFTANRQRLRLKWAHEPRAWQADCHQVVFSDESRFSVWGHDGRIGLRRLPDNNARPHIAKAVLDFCSVPHMQLLSWSAYSPNVSPIQHVWDLVGRLLARDPRPAASKDELLLRIQAIWNSLLQADIQNMFYSKPPHIAALIAALGGYTSSDFGHGATAKRAKAYWVQLSIRDLGPEMLDQRFRLSGQSDVHPPALSSQASSVVI